MEWVGEVGQDGWGGVCGVAEVEWAGKGGWVEVDWARSRVGVVQKGWWGWNEAERGRWVGEVGRETWNG